MRKYCLILALVLPCVSARAIDPDFGFFKTYSLPVLIARHDTSEKYSLVPVTLKMEQLGPIAEYWAPTAILWGFTAGGSPLIGVPAGVLMNRYMHGVNAHHARHPTLIGPDGVERRLEKVAKGLNETQFQLLRAAAMGRIVVGNGESAKKEKVDKLIIELDAKNERPQLGFQLQGSKGFLTEDQVRAMNFLETCEAQLSLFKKLKR